MNLAEEKGELDKQFGLLDTTKTYMDDGRLSPEPFRKGLSDRCKN